MAEQRTMANPRAKHWCFTINNYTQQTLERLITFNNNEVVYLVCGKETGEEGTPHLQGFVSFKKKQYLARAKRILLNNEEGHFSVARTIKNSIEYCKKDDDWFEHGTPTHEVQEINRQNTNQGKRNDLELFKEDVKMHQGKATMEQMREIHSEIASKYPQFFREYINDCANQPIIPIGELKEWQQSLKNILDGEPDSRQIIFVVDVQGNTGKTWFSMYMVGQTKQCQCLNPGKFADMAFALNNNNEIVIIDAPRSKQGEYLQYDFLEAVKNGYVFSPKYESRYKQFKSPHVVVMMNEEPDMAKLSADRYNIIYPL